MVKRRIRPAYIDAKECVDRVRSFLVGMRYYEEIAGRIRRWRCSGCGVAKALSPDGDDVTQHNHDCYISNLISECDTVLDTEA